MRNEGSLFLFALQRLQSEDSFSIEIPATPYAREVFVVRKEQSFYVYENACPHTGGPLDWMPNRFLSLDKTHIQCSTHHALFAIESGYCVAGPCAGQYLKSVHVVVRDGNVYLQE